MKKKCLDTFNGLKVNSNVVGELAVYPAILTRIYDQLLALQSYYSRITIVRIDLHFPDSHTPNHKLENQLISRYIRTIKIDLGSKVWGKHSRFIHGWVKETGKTAKSHYHLFVGMQSLQRVLGVISDVGHTGLWGLLNRRWYELTGGTVQFSKFHVLNREDKQAFAACFYHLSYLAKTRDKHFNTGETHRRFSFSSLDAKQSSTERRTLATGLKERQVAC